MLTNMFSTTTHLINHDNIFSKIVFTIFIIIIFYVLLQVGLFIIDKMIVPNDDPILINELVASPHPKRIHNNPNIANSKPIMRSVNKPSGIEFSWSVWVFLEIPSASPELPAYIFFKGEKNEPVIKATGINGVNGPGVYIDKNYENLMVYMDLYNDDREIITVHGIPIRKWVNIIIRCNQSVLDVFINGTLAQSRELTDIPKQNYDDTYAAKFNGQLSLLQYYSYAIDLLTIQDIIKKGPNLKSKETNIYKESKPQYLSLQWFFNS